QLKIQAKGGKIILIGSEPGKDGSKAKGSVAYGFTKSLLFRLAELINAEGRDKNISAHVIIPTTMDTPQNRAAMPKADFSKWTTPEKVSEEIFAAVN
ncbi:MAG: short-chain dehydrogenase, partial [Bacteroidota bacterium]